MQLKVVPLALPLCAILALSAPSQLSGSYTVGAGGNYANLALAIADLNTLGVSAPVSFLVTGPEAGPFTINAFPGMGAANPVYFLGGGTAALTITAGTVLTLNGCTNIIIDGFTGTFTTGSAIAIAGSNNTIRACNFSMPVVTSGTTNKIFAINSGTGVIIEDNTFGGGYEAFGSLGPCDQLLIQRNRIQGGGFWTGQILGTNVTFRNNFVYGTTQYGLRAGAATTNLRILNNSFYMTQATGSTQFCALRWYGTTYGEVINNSFTDVQVGANGNIMWCSGTLVPTVMDYNTHNLVNGLGIVSISNVQYTFAQWQATGKDLNGSVGDPLYVNVGATPPDLHISPASPNFLSGVTNANVTDDIDLQPRAGIPCRGADELPPPPLYAAFATPAVTTAPCGFGPLAFTVNFTDLSASTDPGGITTWSWDLNGDSVIDSNLQNPSYTYAVPGTYSVSLTVTDAVNPPYTQTRTNLITAQPYRFRMQTAGAGTGDLYISPIPNSQVPTAATGFMFVSFATANAVNSGPFFGIWLDFFSWNTVLSPATVGDLFHWVATPGFFPNTGFGLPAGALAGLAGLTVDAVQVDFTVSMTVANASTVARVTF